MFPEQTHIETDFYHVSSSKVRHDVVTAGKNFFCESTDRNGISEIFYFRYDIKKEVNINAGLSTVK